MAFLELAKLRCSVRRFRTQEVEEEKLHKILEAGRVAPSACNYQPLHFIVVRDKENKTRVASTYPEGWIGQAPVIIVVCGDHSASWKRADGKDHLDIDVAIAADHMTLQAAELGLGTCWVCWFDAIKCHSIMKLPKKYETIALLPLGYPKERCNPDRHNKKRKTLQDLMSWEVYNR